MAIINHANPINPATAALLETAPGRQLSVDLGRAWDLLNPETHPYFDDLTVSLRQWHTLFAERLTLERNAPELLEECKRLLAEKLQDPVTGDPLDADALIGPDGQTYNRRTLHLLGQAQGQDPRAEPHPLLPTLLGYLISYLPAQNREAPPVDRRAALLARAERLGNRIGRRNIEARPEVARFAEQMDDLVDRFNHRLNNEIVIPEGARLQALEGTADQLLAQEEGELRDQLQAIREENLERARTAAALREENRQLQAHLDESRDRVSAMKRSDMEVQMEINACRAEMNEKKSSGWAIACAVILVVVCIAVSGGAGAGAVAGGGAGGGTAAAGAATSSSTVGATLSPTPGGGLRIFTFLRF